MLRKKRSSSRPPTITSTTTSKPPVPSKDSPSTTSSLIASFMLYGLAVEGKISTDVSIQGRLEGIHIRDTTPAGKNYPDILAIGLGDEGTHLHHHQQQQEVKRCLSFSINRSPQSSISLPGVAPPTHSDVHLSVFVPAIHYLHSVNFVYEIEMFVSEFLKYFTSVMTKTFKSAAVGVAKEFVRQESQLAKGLSRLHTSFGHTEVVTGSSADATGGAVAVEETDTGLPFQLGSNKLFF